MLGRIDLSKVDFQGNKMKTMETANCYIVKKPGKYKLPLVYGNAIKNGKNNILAYTNFSDYHDNPIESPWISSDEIVRAAVIWQDKNIEIENLRFGFCKLYLKFNITGSTKCAGNAVIGIFDVKGSCIWSWHIWYYPGPLEKLWIGYEKVKKKLPEHYNIGVLSAPLGYDGEEEYLYYQWGRKDPFRGYNFKKRHQLMFDEERIITTGIQNPDTIISELSHSYYNLWDSVVSKDEVRKEIKSYFGFTKRSIKTIYDPCPRGFKVPGEDIYYYLNKSSFDIINGPGKHGITFYTPDKGILLLQARGYLNVDLNKISKIDEAGYFWTAHRTDRAKCYWFIPNSSSSVVTSYFINESISKGFCILPAID